MKKNFIKMYFEVKFKECIICGNNDDRECCLIGIFGTQEGGIMQAVPVHTGCLNLGYDKENKIIYQVLTK